MGHIAIFREIVASTTQLLVILISNFVLLVIPTDRDLYYTTNKRGAT